MSKDLSKRRRKVNLDEMDGDTQEAVGLEVGKKVGVILDAAGKDINAILGIYGLKGKLSYILVDPKTGEPMESYNALLTSSEE